MLHHGGKRHAVGLRQFCNRGLPPAKSRQDGATGGIGKRRKCRIEPLTIVNHRVKYSGSQSLVKLAVFSPQRLRIPLTRSLCAGSLLAISSRYTATFGSCGKIPLAQEKKKKKDRFWAPAPFS
jgi:hypothetical protein